MTYKIFIPSIIAIILISSACGSQERTDEKAKAKEETNTSKEEPTIVVTTNKEPHRYGRWYCPDNFGFEPVDILKLDEVPAISHRLPTEIELQNNMSLIKVDTVKYPDARALNMDLPKVASIYSEKTDMPELIIVIQAIIVQEDTVVGYRFVNGGNGSAWLSDITFLSEDELAEKGSQPFYYSKAELKSNTKNIWQALSKTDYFKQLGDKFDRKDFFSSKWNPEANAHLSLESKDEKVVGYVGMVFGNYYLHIDYNRSGFHYSEKMLISENKEENTAEIFFASGPYPNDFENEKVKLDLWFEDVVKMSQEH